MANELELPQDFKTAMREKILASVMGLIPPEKINALIESEINAFFNLEVQLTFVSISYSSRAEMQTLMTPFRQMVWAELTKVIRPTVETAIKDKTERLRSSVTQYLTEVDTQVSEGTNAVVDRMVRAASASMLSYSIGNAIANSQRSIEEGLRNAGFHDHNLDKATAGCETA